jgi:hypothetical protein
MKSSIICIILVLATNCSVKRSVNDLETSSENLPASQGTGSAQITPLSSLLKNFKNVVLPYPNNVDTFNFKKFPRHDEMFLRKTFLLCDFITLVDESNLNVWDPADLMGDSLAMKYLAEDTSQCIVPGFIIFKNENFVAVSLHTGSEQQGIYSNYLLADRVVLCTINNEGRCINAITAGYTNGNVNGYVHRTFACDTSMTFHIYEKGGVTQDSSQYSIQWDYKILTDGRFELQ